MANQYVRAGGVLDIPSKEELSEAMGHSFSANMRSWLEGIDYVQYAGVANGANTFTIPESPESGYTWSVKLISAQLSGEGQLSMYLSENNAVAPIGTIYAAPNGSLYECVATWSANQVVMKDNRTITLYCAAANILNYRIHVKAVPTQMQGKL